MAFDLDLFVIGGGSGGVRAARIAAGHGASVALAEQSRMGGTCVIRGCVPKKLMIFASQAGLMAEEMRGYGWTGATAGAHDWPAFHGRLRGELDRLERAYRSGLTGAGVTIHDQRATLADPHTVQLADGTRLTARHILIATGGHPVRPDIPGARLGLVSDDLFLMETPPRRVLLVGGGYIACEFATILAGLGVQAVQSVRASAVLRGFDAEATTMVADQLRAIGVDLRLQTEITRLDDAAGGVTATFQDGHAEEFGAVFFCTGRDPNTAGLGLDTLGLVLGRNGAVPVDAWSQTPIPSVFAVGDVTDRVALTPVAIREGHAFADTVFAARPRRPRHDPVASAVYLRPHELAAIGPTEDAAAASGPVDVYATTFRPMQSAFAGSGARALMKLLVDPATDRVLGCHIFAPQAGEMIQLAAIPVTMGATKAQFDDAVAVHPTMAEELVTMRQPVRRHPGPETGPQG